MNHNRKTCFLGPEGSNAFNPGDLSDLNTWLKDASINYDPDTGTWTDSSGNSNNFTQSTESSRPSLVTDVYGGQSAVQFDGVGDFLNIPANTRNAFGTSDFTAFVVMSPLVEDTDEHGIIRIFGASTSFLKYLYINYDTPSTTPVYGLGFYTGSGTDFPASGRASEDIPTLYELRMEGTGVDELRKVIHSSDVDTDTDTMQGATDTVTGGVIGRASNANPQRYTNMDVMEIIVFDRALTDTEVNQVRNYLYSKYTI